jgi:hypothetical protein
MSFGWCVQNVKPATKLLPLGIGRAWDYDGLGDSEIRKLDLTNLRVGDG